ncbi:MAG: fibronectin type III domain-containing protein [Parcubacteria group bacterium Gr01-1014_8]|nr:MAG: fibronectin type III domain-containing protein [Parcubacteria group bacterium Gr01-1014_8]
MSQIYTREPVVLGHCVNLHHMRPSRVLVSFVVALVLIVPAASHAQIAENIQNSLFALFNQIIGLQKQLIRDIDKQLSAVRSELDMNKGMLAYANGQLSALGKQVSSTQSELSDVKSQLATCKNQLPPPKPASCTWSNGVTYPDGSIIPFMPTGGYNFSSSAVPASAMAVCMAPCGGYVVYYKCQNGDWVQVTTGYPNPYPIALKPVIYLYPTSTQEVTVKLKYRGELAYTYPEYDTALGGWRVIAEPSGTLTNLADSREYSYLFWEGKEYPIHIDEARGFVVKGSDTRAFLQAKLAELGLLPREYNEMIVYWLPKMQDNPYTFVQFVGEEYTSSASLSISPKPDSILRVFMAIKPLDSYTEVIPQKIEPFERKGFTVVEWGGMEITE